MHQHAWGALKHSFNACLRAGWAPPIITLQTPTLPAVTAPPASVQEAVLVAAARTGPASGGDQASLPEAGAQARGVVQQQEGDLGHDDGSGSGGEGGLLGLGGYISSEDDGDADGKDGGVLAGSEGQEVGGSGLDGEAGTVGADSDDSEGQETESDEGVVAFNEGHSFF